MTDDLFVTGTDTNVGKTVLSALLVAALDAIYWKPIQTGASEGTDRRHGDDAGQAVPEERRCRSATVSIRRFRRIWPRKQAASTHRDLAKSRGRDLASGKSLIVEGAGGILVPINDTESMLDLICASGHAGGRRLAHRARHHQSHLA